MVNAQHPDLIVFTGDLINNKATELDGYEEVLSMLSAKDGVYSILGNHDYGPYYKWKNPKEQADNLIALKQKEANMGWIMLNNDHHILHHKGDSIALIGVENWGMPPFFRARRSEESPYRHRRSTFQIATQPQPVSLEKDSFASE